MGKKVYVRLQAEWVKWVGCLYLLHLVGYEQSDKPLASVFKSGGNWVVCKDGKRLEGDFNTLRLAQAAAEQACGVVKQ